MELNIKLTVDYAFKRIFGHNDNIEILKKFLNDVMGLEDDNKICSLTIQNPFSIKDFESEKANILDIRAKDNFGRLYDIEVQTIILKDYAKRILHYASNLYTKQITEGDNYDKLKPVISISILEDNLFDNCDSYSNKFVLKNEKNNLILTDSLYFYTFELSKFNLNRGDISNPIDEWLYLLKNFHIKNVKDFDNLKNIPIKKILEVINKMEALGELDFYYKRAKLQVSVLEAEKEGERRGKEKGIQIGEEIGKEKGIQIGEEIGKEKGIQIGKEKAFRLVKKKVSIKKQ